MNNNFKNDKFRFISKIGQSDIGFLSFFESQKEIPFEIKRIYYIYQVPKGAKRGMHAHKNLEQLLWCPYGEIEIELFDGKIKEKVFLNTPEKTLYVAKGIWRDMYWKKKGSVLCVAASDYYNENDYIRDYDEYLKMVHEDYWKLNSYENTYSSQLDKFRRVNGIDSESINEVLAL